MKPQFRSMTVTRGEQGAALRDFIAARLKISRRAAKEIIDARNVFVNRQCVWMARHTLHAGDHVETRHAGVEPEPPRLLRVLADFDSYLFVDKPVGMLSIGDGGLEEAIRSQLSDPTLRCVHRLDRNTSGCLLVARGRDAHDAAVEIFKTRKVRKVYHLLVAGRLRDAATTIDTPIRGQTARTHIRRIAGNDIVTYVQARIETGRTHQIRLHLASIRHPVIGDRQHGLKTSENPLLLRVPRQMLHALELEMPHPSQSLSLKAHSPLPADFRRCLRLFGI